VDYVKRRHPENGGAQSYSKKEEVEGPLRNAVDGATSKDDVKGPLRDAQGASEFVEGAEMTTSEEFVSALDVNDEPCTDDGMTMQVRADRSK